MSNIIIDYENLSITSSIYQYDYIEYFIFKNVPDHIKYFQIQGLYLFGIDDNNKITTSSNYHINTAPNDIDFSFLDALNIKKGKIEISLQVSMPTNMKKLIKRELEDMKKCVPETTKIGKIILEIHFFDNNNLFINKCKFNINISENYKFKHIVKIKSGLIEKNNPLLYSKMTDFFGSGSYTRNENIFTIYNGFCERNFKHKEFILIIQKEPNVLIDTDEYGMYNRISGRRTGIIECVNSKNGVQKTATHWKFLYYNGFIETYLSYDNMNEWILLGGGQHIEETNIQGFYVNSKTPLIIKDYKVYDNPYIKFLNIPNDYYLRIYDKNNKLIGEKCSLNGIIEFNIERPIENGSFVILNENETMVYKSETLDINLGDIFDDLNYQLEVLYNKNIIGRYSTTHLNKHKEIITVKNVSNDKYTNIDMNILNNSDIDKIEISFDDITYSNKITISSLNPNEEIDIYLRITTNKNYNDNYGKKHFSIEFN